MPVDKNIDEEDAAKDDKDTSVAVEGRQRRFKEFDCPDCGANNPHDDTFGDADVLTCNYCGQEYLAVVNNDGRLKMKPT